MTETAKIVIAMLAGLPVALFAAWIFCRRLLSEKEEPWRTRLQEMEKTCADKIAEKEKACADKVAEKEKACAAMIAEKDKACAAMIAEKEKACADKVAEKEKTCDRIVAEKNEEVGRFIAEKEKAFEKTVDTLREQFTNLAAQAMKVQGCDLNRMNKEQMEAILKPLREQLARLQESTQKAEADRSNMKTNMAENIGTIENIARELAKSASALKSNTRIQGRMGEEILEEKLKQAGLERNVSYFIQESTGNERPDAQICDTDNRWLVIDSKVSLTAYMEYAAATNEDTRRDRLKAHVTSVKKRISELAAAKYPQALGKEHPQRNYLPVTAMFVPYETPLLEAINADASIWQYAAQNNVVLVTPLTLLSYVRLVYLAWQHEKELNNQREIVDVARELLARMNNYLMAFEKLGKTIDDLQGAYQDAKGIIVDSPRAQTIAKSANRLIGLHVKLESRKGRRLEKAGCLQAIECDSADSSGDAAEIVV